MLAVVKACYQSRDSWLVVVVKTLTLVGWLLL